MLRSLYLSLVYLSFIGLGLAAPFVLSLGYIWVSIARPHYIATSFLTAFPISLVIGVLAVGWFLVRDLRSRPPFTPVLGMTAAMAIWITITTATVAVVPEPAWIKWDWAFKTIVFSGFMVFVFRSRVQIEALLQVIVFSFASHFIPIGVKTSISGGGYGVALGLIGENSGFGEGGTLSAVAQICVPILLFLSKHAMLMPRLPIVRLGYLGLAGLAVIASIGTHQRSGLIGLLVLAGAMWLRTKHKILFGVVCVLGALIMTAVVSDSWTERMATIDDYNNEASARGRILVWQWTLGFVADNPFGGGFHSYMINEIPIPASATQPEGGMIRGKAFHSIYFETLGEHGWIGLALFLAINIATLLSLQRIMRRTRGVEDMAWCHDLAAALQVSLLVLLASGAFIGIAFQPMFWYLFAASGCLAHHVGRALSPAVSTHQQQAAEGGAWTRRNAIPTRPRRGVTGG